MEKKYFSFFNLAGNWNWICFWSCRCRINPLFIPLCHQKKHLLNYHKKMLSSWKIWSNHRELKNIFCHNYIGFIFLFTFCKQLLFSFWDERHKKFIFFPFNPLSAAVFTDFGLIIRGQSVTQGSMGRDSPSYPPWGPGLFSFLERQKFWWRHHKKCVCQKMYFDIRSICTKFEVNTIALSKVIKVLSCVFL